MQMNSLQDQKDNLTAINADLKSQLVKKTEIIGNLAAQLSNATASTTPQTGM